MKYKTGMYGGSFDPLHIGHVQIITRAASVCETLYVVLSYSRARDHIPMEIRYRWIYNIFSHMDNIKIILLEDTAPSKEEYDVRSEWERGRDYVLEQIGNAVDVVFCGSDYKSNNIYEELYGCEVICFDRNEINISSTEIRRDPYKYWDYIPLMCRPYFVKKVLLIGGESTGKSTLTQNLANIYNTNFLEEVGRDVCAFAGNREDLMIAEDFHEILIKHKAKELEQIRSSNRILFVDTDAFTTMWFSTFLLDDRDEIGKITALAEAVQAINSFDLILFLEPTVAFVQDGTRNEKIAAERKKYSEQIKHLFDTHNLHYHPLDGDYLTRFETAKRLIAEELNIRLK